MKRISLFVLLLIPTATIWAQSAKPKTPVKSTKPAPAPAKTVLKNFTDSVSYAIGYSAASFYKQQGLNKINTTMVSAAINDVLNGKPTLMNENSANAVMNQAMTAILSSKSKPAIDSGAAFLARNKKRPGVKTTPSGLQYEVITEGTGIKPTAEDTFVCHYRGTLLNGTEFDASYNRNQPLTYPVNEVIRGWTEGLQLMSVGSKYKFYIPYDLAYGPSDNGPIPGGSTLVFEVELLDVKKKQ